MFHFFALVSRLSAALCSVAQHAMPPEFGRKWGTECLNTRFPLPTLLCAGYSVKLILIYFNFFAMVRCRGKTRRRVPPLNTQCLQNSVESGGQSLLTLGSFCLPCCVRNTAWSWDIRITHRQHTHNKIYLVCTFMYWFCIIWQ